MPAGLGWAEPCQEVQGLSTQSAGRCSCERRLVATTDRAWSVPPARQHVHLSAAPCGWIDVWAFSLAVVCFKVYIGRKVRMCSEAILHRT